jgi:hypothetical protein
MGSAKKPDIRLKEIAREITAKKEEVSLLMSRNPNVSDGSKISVLICDEFESLVILLNEAVKRIEASEKR